MTDATTGGSRTRRAAIGYEQAPRQLGRGKNRPVPPVAADHIAGPGHQPVPARHLPTVLPETRPQCTAGNVHVAAQGAHQPPAPQ